MQSAYSGHFWGWGTPVQRCSRLIQDTFGGEVSLYRDAVGLFNSNNRLDWPYIYIYIMQTKQIKLINEIAEKNILLIKDGYLFNK